MLSRNIVYNCDDQKFIGKLFHEGTEPKATVMVVHDWSGLNNFAEASAKKLVAAGYNAFCVDMYGNGKIGTSVEEKTALMTPLMEDRNMLLKRLQKALEALQGQGEVDSNKVSAIGFCFGGLCVLDLARSGAALKSVASFHGLLIKPPFEGKSINAKIMALHGHNDPMVPPEQVLAFQKEMEEAKANWEMLIFGKTLHSFANPEANTPEDGTQYNEYAANRSWDATFKLLENTL